MVAAIERLKAGDESDFFFPTSQPSSASARPVPYRVVISRAARNSSSARRRSCSAMSMAFSPSFGSTWTCSTAAFDVRISDDGSARRSSPRPRVPRLPGPGGRAPHRRLGRDLARLELSAPASNGGWGRAPGTSSRGRWRPGLRGVKRSAADCIRRGWDRPAVPVTPERPATGYPAERNLTGDAEGRPWRGTASGPRRGWMSGTGRSRSSGWTRSGPWGMSGLPFSLKVLLENLLRNEDGAPSPPRTWRSSRAGTRPRPRTARSRSRRRGC